MHREEDAASVRTSSGLAVKVHHHQYKQQVIGVDRVFSCGSLWFLFPNWPCSVQCTADYANRRELGNPTTTTTVCVSIVLASELVTCTEACFPNCLLMQMNLAVLMPSWRWRTICLLAVKNKNKNINSNEFHKMREITVHHWFTWPFRYSSLTQALTFFHFSSLAASIVCLTDINQQQRKQFFSELCEYCLNWFKHWKVNSAVDSAKQSRPTVFSGQFSDRQSPSNGNVRLACPSIYSAPFYHC